MKMRTGMKGRISSLMLLLLLLMISVAEAAASTILGTIPLDKVVDSVALAPNTTTAYGIISEAKTLYVFNLGNYSVKKTISLDRKPLSIAVNPATNSAYITARDDNKRGLLYMADSEGVLSVTAIPRDPKGIAIDTERNSAVICLETDKQLLLLSLDTLTAKTTINLPHRPAAVALDADSNRAVVLAGEAEGEGKQNRILVVDLNTGETLLNISLKKEIKSLAVDLGKDIAVAVSGTEINLVDINTGNILSTSAANAADGVDINQSTHTAVIPDKKEMLLLDLATLSATRYSLNTELQAVAVDAFRNTALLSGKGEALEVQLPNPVPEIEGLMPKAARAGDAGFTLSVLGNRFITTTTVQFNLKELITTFKDNTSIEAEIPASLLGSADTVPVTATNPSPEGGTSAPFYFTIKYPAPVLTSMTPDAVSARSAGFSLKVNGSYFMPGYIVNFNGQDLETVYIDSDEMSALVPSALVSEKGSYQVVVIAPDRQNSNVLYFTVSDPSPAITDFEPKEGTAGTVVTIMGDNFAEIPTGISFNGSRATILSISQAEIKAVVPSGASTGPISVTTSVGSAQSAGPFTILSRQDFEIDISPQTLSIPATGSARAVISLRSTGTEPFGGLVKLTLTESADTIRATFNPLYISVKQSSILSLASISTLSSGLTLNISGTALIEGVEMTRTASLVLSPVPQGTTTLAGQILASKDAMPISNVKVSLGDSSVFTDVAGNFIFIDPPVGEQILVIDGETANQYRISYPSAIPVPVVISGGIDNILPYHIYLHEVKTEYYTVIDPSKDTVVTDPGIPNYEMLIPAGVIITGLDGYPNEKISVKPVPIDRLPIAPPPAGVYASEIYMYYFFKPGGGTPSQPIPVKMPNTMQAEPGTRVNLWYYDESFTPDPSSNQWKEFGMGTVSDDGLTIIPDPGVGIPKFCCGASFPSPPPPPDGPPPPPPDNDDPCGGVGDPVDPFSGMFTLKDHDIGYQSPSKLSVQRLYNSGNTKIGHFGRGFSIDFDYFLTGLGNALTFMTPDGGRYILSKRDDGSYTNESYPFLKSAKAYLNPDNTRTMQFRDGVTYTFDSNGRLLKETDRNGNYIAVKRDGTGYVAGLSDNYGNTLDIKTSSITINRIIYTVISSITDAAGRTVRYTYDNTKATLTQVTNPEGGQTTYGYDSNNRITSVTNPRGERVVENIYSSAGRVIHQRHADGGEYEFIYEVVPPTSGIVTSVTVRDPNDGETTYRQNGRGYTLEKTDALGQKTLYERENSTNRLLSETDSLGRKKTYMYDENGNTSSVIDPAGNVTVYQYDLTLNKPVKITDAMGNVTTMGYDSKGNLLQIIVPGGEITTMTYNTFGQPTSVTDALGNKTTLEYDAYGRLSKTTDPLGNTARMEYDSMGRLVKSIDPSGKKTSYEYDIGNRVTAVTDPMVKTTNYTYDMNGNLLSVTDAKGQVISYTYNLRDKMKTMTDQLGKVERYIYDLNDNLTSVIDRKGQRTTYAYDGLNRVTRATFADGSHSDYTFDAVGKLTFINDSASGPIEYVYSNTGCSTGCGGGSADKLMRAITPLGSISYEYDALGRRTKMQVAGQPAVNYEYDANSRLTNISSNLGSSILNFEFMYDAIGRRTALELPNGVKTNYTYDNASKLMNIEHLNPLDEIFEKINYIYDPNGNRTKMDRQNVLVKLPTPVANTAYNQANRMLTANDKNITYDDNGNMTTVTNSCGTTTYTWDARNLLVGINGFDTLCALLSASFKYDAIGRRIEKTVNGKATTYLYDVMDIVQEIKNGTVAAYYIRTLNLDEPLARIKSDGPIRYYQQDALGSVIALTDETGLIKTQYNYDPFGNTDMIGEDSDNPFQYTGRENDGSGLYYYRARYYYPELQRFISEDPIGFDGGDVNLYAYVWNQPTRYVDPYGLLGADTIGAIGGWIGKQIVKQIGKGIAKKAIPDKGLNLPEHGDDDNDGTPNFMDPDSENCKVNCDKPLPPSNCH